MELVDVDIFYIIHINLNTKKYFVMITHCDTISVISF